jgi:hypothetical protein
VRLLHGATLNTALRPLLSAVELLGVNEEVPRMHDIFIRVVSEDRPAGQAGGPATVKADMTE